LRKLWRGVVPSPSFAIAFLALVLAVGGGAFAIASSDGKKIRKIANRVVTKRAHKLSVRHATSADHANTAESAATAASASATNGMHLAKLDARMPAGTGETTVFTANGLTLSATCSAGGDLNLTGTTSVDNSEINEQGGYGAVFHQSANYEFDVGDVENVGANMGDGTQDNVSGSVIYSTPDGAVVTIILSISETAHGGHGGCDVEGTAIYS
jgi:hypothetical protein